MSVDRTLYLKILAEKYQSVQAVCREIINLNAILNLPKGTEHFMSDLHGEYEAFCHILNNCSGVIREKVDLLFEEQLNDSERQAICTLIYYPKEKLEQLKKENNDFLLNNLGPASKENLSGLVYEYPWGKVMSYCDFKSAETGIVICYF